MSDIETCIKVIPINENMIAEVEALRKEGWEVTPQFPPFATYCLQRAKQPQFTAQAKMIFDELKIMVIPASQKN